MNTQKIELSTMYTPYTLDTYQTFAFDTTEEHKIENYNQDNGTDFDYDSFDWTYRTAEYLKDLSISLGHLLNENILDEVIQEVEIDGDPWSPRQYNHATDEVNIIFAVNKQKLDEYIEKNMADYTENKIQDVSGFFWFGDDDQTKLNYYLKNVSAELYTPWDYIQDQCDRVGAYEYVYMELIKE